MPSASNVAVLVSGNGTNLQALIDAEKRGELSPARICCVISNRPGAYALERAESAGIPAVVIDHCEFEDRPSFEAELTRVIHSFEARALVLAGFMRILTDGFVGEFKHRIINTHPALCPSFPGIRAPEQALEYGVKVTGCTVHLVDGGVDTGPIIFQAAVDVEPDDDAASLHRRIQAHEHALLPKAVQLLANDRLRVDGRVVHVAAS